MNDGIECTLSRFAEGTSWGEQDGYSDLDGLQKWAERNLRRFNSGKVLSNFGYPRKRKILAYQREPRRVLPKHLRGLEHMTFQERKEQGLFSRKKRKFQEELTAVYIDRVSGCRGDKAQLFSEEQSGRTRSKRHMGNWDLV